MIKILNLHQPKLKIFYSGKNKHNGKLGQLRDILRPLGSSTSKLYRNIKIHIHYRDRRDYALENTLYTRG